MKDERCIELSVRTICSQNAVMVHILKAIDRNILLYLYSFKKVVSVKCLVP